MAFYKNQQKKMCHSLYGGLAVFVSHKEKIVAKNMSGGWSDGLVSWW